MDQSNQVRNAQWVAHSEGLITALYASDLFDELTFFSSLAHWRLNSPLYRYDRLSKAACAP